MEAGRPTTGAANAAIDWRFTVGDRVKIRLVNDMDHPMQHLCVPKSSSVSCDQAIFVDQAADASLFQEAVLAEIERFG